MAVDLDAVLASRAPGVFIEATLGGATIKFAPLTILALADISAGKLELGLAAIIPDAEQRRAVEALPIDALDSILTAVYGNILGK